MNYFKEYKEEIAYYNRSVAFGVGEENDSYSINSYYRHNVKDDTIISQHEVVKNWISPEKEILFKGTLKECFQFIEDIVSPKY